MAGQRNKNKKSKHKNKKKNKNHVRGEPPQALVCPITLDLMRDPVMDANGHTFDRSAIERSLVNQPGKRTLPQWRRALDAKLRGAQHDRRVQRGHR
jgi:hypothetical protein